MNYQDKELQQRLAAEYVLGTLQGLARRRFQRLLIDDLDLQQAVRVWERRLSPLALGVPAESAPEAIWTAIRERIGFTAQQPQAQMLLVNAQTLSRLRTWRWAAMGNAALAAGLAAFIVFGALKGVIHAPQATDIAVLNSSQHAEPVWIVRQRGVNTLELSGLSHIVVPAGRVLELWAIPAQGAPVSIGLLRVGAHDQAQVSLTTIGLQHLKQAKVLAISLEPLGGSTTGAPTGAVRYSGKVVG